MTARHFQRDFLPGDLIGFSRPSIRDWALQVGGLAFPYVWPFDIMGIAGLSNIGLVCHNQVYVDNWGVAEPVLDIPWSLDYITKLSWENIYAFPGRVWHIPLSRELYNHEAARLNRLVVSCVTDSEAGHSLDSTRFVALILANLGVLNRSKFVTPTGLYRYCVRHGSHLSRQLLK